MRIQEATLENPFDQNEGPYCNIQNGMLENGHAEIF